MNKKICIGILIGLIIICLDVLILGNDSTYEEQSRRDILADNSVIDLGSHVIAYRTSSDVLDITCKGNYLALDDLDSGESLYLPDIYEEVYKIELEDDGSIFISFKDMIHTRIQAASIPVCFPSQDNPAYEITEIQRKILTEAQGNIGKAAEELPKLIWSEKVNCESVTYEITFERTSFAYKSLDGKGELFADYCLTLKDGDGNILAEQTMINYPIGYEEVYWVKDFSGDGLPDIAFYTGIFQSDGANLEFIMSNAETKAYEAVRLPIRLTKTKIPVWNEKQSTVILYEMLYQDVTMKMYSFHDMEWELVDELLPMYEEDEGSIWARNNKESVKLYPEIYSEGEWESIELTIGEDTVTKYARRETVKTNEGSIFSDGNIVYLGGYMKAYLRDTSMNPMWWEYEGEWLVINDAEEGKNIYLRNEFSKILDIRIEDFSAIYIKYENSEEEGVQELTVPLCFSWKKENVLELDPDIGQVVTEPPTAALALPETVWVENFTYQGTSYLAAFERISPAYFGSECYGNNADYQLVVKDENGNTIASQVITGYPITMEEVHWLKDISGDSFPDVILCSFCEQDRYLGYGTALHFFIWNKEKLMYESKPLADDMYGPFWSEELSSLILYSPDDDTYMRYTFRGGGWQLSDKLAEEDWGETYDENSPWCRRNVQNEKLFPRSEGWDTEEKELEGGQTAWKFVREKDKRSNEYFYAEGETVHTYEGYFYLHSYTALWQDVDLYITELEHFSSGTLYALELEQPESSDPLDELYGHKYIGYFYVTDEIISYYKDHITNEDGFSDENNKRIIEWIEKDEADFLEHGTIVCCEEGTEDITDENGYHAYVEVDGDKRIFRVYNDYFYGSKGYMLMVWEKGKGLTYCMSGNGNMNMHVEFGHNIKEEQKADYGYPFKRFHES